MNFVIAVWIICLIFPPIITVAFLEDCDTQEEKNEIIFYASVVVIFGPFVVFPVIAIAICYFAWYIGCHVFDAWKFKINKFRKWMEE